MKKNVNSRKAIIIGIVIAAVAIPLGIYSVLPLFINTEINEPLPTVSNGNNVRAAIREFRQFMEMGEEERSVMGHLMDVEERDMIMIGADQLIDITVNVEMTNNLYGKS